MAAKKKAKKKKTKSRLTARKKTAPAKKTKKKSARKATPAKSVKKLAKKAHKKSPAASVRAKAGAAKAKTTSPSTKPVRERREGVDETLPGTRRAPAQSEDLRGVSRAERADSESVDELLDEGNTFEAGVVSGVEEADSADEREVHTREFPEDDVPEEYLDKD
jgi:hypothetical protein